MPAVLVHGVPDTPHLWEPVRSHLSRDDVLAPALPGFVGDEPDGWDATKESYLAWLVAQVEALGEPVDLVGHDWGGILCVGVAGSRPDLVRTLAARQDEHPVTLWIVTRGVLEAADAGALRQSCLWGIAGVIGAEQSQLWGGLVDIPAVADLADCAAALTGVMPTAAKSVLILRDGEFRTRALAPISGPPARDPMHCRPDAASVVVHGQLVGNITATDSVEVAATGMMEGDIRAPRVALAEGARFRGRIDMSPAPGKEAPK